MQTTAARLAYPASVGRLPFDPGKMASKKARDDRPLSVSELAARVDSTLKRGMGEPVRVVGEISGFRDRTHWYFDLKDAGAVIGCVIFASSARRLSIRPADGQEVVARGRIEFWAKGGKLSLLCDSLEPVGEGALDQAFRQLCAELRGLGWFEQSAKKPIPGFAKRVAVVTSETGAALQDVLDTAGKRCPAIDITVIDVRVQGQAAAGEIARAIQLLDSRPGAFEAIILTRGGGSKEDLWAFNEREVAQAIHVCSIPIVAAIGHESDTTIAELVADLRCATPTQAAMAVFPDREALGRQIDSMQRRMQADIRRRLELARRRVGQAEQRPWMRDPRRLLDPIADKLIGRERTLRREMQLRLQSARARLDRLAVQLDAHRPAVVHARLRARVEARQVALGTVLAKRLGEHKWRIASAERELEAISPHRVLERGFSWTTGTDGMLVRSAAQVSPGDVIETRLADGSIASKVTDAVSQAETSKKAVRTKKAPNDRRGSKSASKAQSESNPGPDQMDLF